MKATRISQAILGFVILTALCFGCNSNHADSRFKILVSSDSEGETFTIMDTATDSLIYDGGHNIITLDTVINGNYIFFEDNITEECMGWLLVYNPEDALLMKAYLDWGGELDTQDWELLLNNGIGKIYEIEHLDIAGRTIEVRLFNGCALTLELKGERHGNYWVVYHVSPYIMVADTLILSPGDTIITMNNSIHCTVYYKGKFISEPNISYASFKGIQNPEKYILAPTDKVWFKTDGDELVANTGMYMYDTDCGYWVEIRIDSTGRKSLSYIENEENMGDRVLSQASKRK
jgi:hypothetical protein